MSQQTLNNNKQTCNSTTVAQPLRVTLGFKLSVFFGGFCILVALGLLISHIQFKKNYPLDYPPIKELKAKLVENPKDEELKKKIREIDLQVRIEHDRHLRFVRTGKTLLLIGAIGFLASIQAAIWRKRMCVIKNKNQNNEANLNFIRSAMGVTTLGIIIAAAGFILVSQSETNIPELKESIAAQAQISSYIPTLEEMARQWPRFRGYDGNALAYDTNCPTHWDVEKGINILWKTQVPSNGFNSPIVWSNRVFLSAGTKDKREVFCYDARSGKLLWQKAIENVPGSAPKPPEIPDYTGFAAATMATDGTRAFVIFANYDLAALSFDGKIVWSKNLGIPKNAHGHASSLLTYSNLLILQLDQGEIEDKLSKLYAFDTATGKVVWEKQRPVASSWTTPIVVNAAGKTQIITVGLPYIISYSLTDGSELWRIEGTSGEVTPSPISAGDIVFAISPSDKLFAINPDGSGDVTKTKIIWTSEENIPDITSPVANRQYIFTITTMGMLTCHNAVDGKKIWEHDYQLDFHTSPSLVGDKIYLFSVNGNVFIVRAGDKYEEISAFKMDDKFHASPAFANSCIYIRGEKYLYCIGKTQNLASN